jgi:hypothetical protein
MLGHLRAAALRPVLTDASCDYLPERNHSPGLVPVPGSGRDTGDFAALSPTPTPQPVLLTGSTDPTTELMNNGRVADQSRV